MNKDEFKTLAEKVDSIQTSLDVIDKDLEHDRSKWDELQEVQNRLGHLEQEVKSLREIIQKIPQKTQDKIAEVTAPIIEEAYDLKKTIDKKKTLVLKEKKKPWWKIWG